MSNKIADELLKNISSISKKKKEKNVKSKPVRWFKRNLFSVGLVLLLVFSVAQAAQLGFIYSNLSNSGSGGTIAPSTLDSLPDMVGGC